MASIMIYDDASSVTLLCVWSMIGSNNWSISTTGAQDPSIVNFNPSGTWTFTAVDPQSNPNGSVNINTVSGANLWVCQGINMDNSWSDPFHAVNVGDSGTAIGSGNGQFKTWQRTA